jgi:hypothetical protein
LLAGDATATQGFFIDATELAFEQSVIVFELLLLNEAESIIRGFAAGLRTMNARAVIAALKIFGGAKNRDAETAADANAGTYIASNIKIE